MKQKDPTSTLIKILDNIETGRISPERGVHYIRLIRDKVLKRDLKMFADIFRKIALGSDRRYDKAMLSMLKIIRVD